MTSTPSPFLYFRSCLTTISIIPPPRIFYRKDCEAPVIRLLSRIVTKISVYIIQSFLMRRVQTGKHFRNKWKSFWATDFILGLREHAANLDEIVACLENWRLPKRNIWRDLAQLCHRDEIQRLSCFCVSRVQLSLLNTCIWRKSRIKTGALCCRNLPHNRSAYCRGLVSSVGAWSPEISASKGKGHPATGRGGLRGSG
jgi:hypothetical protein